MKWLLLLFPYILSAQTFEGTLTYRLSQQDSTGGAIDPYLADTLVVQVAKAGVFQYQKGTGSQFVHSKAQWPILYLVDSAAAFVLDDNAKVAYRRPVTLFRTENDLPIKWTKTTNQKTIAGYSCTCKSEDMKLPYAGGKVRMEVCYSPTLKYPSIGKTEDARFEQALNGAIPLYKRFAYLQLDLIVEQTLLSVKKEQPVLAIPAGYRIEPWNPNIAY